MQEISTNEMLYAKAVARAWSDDIFRTRLLNNPKQVLSEEGMVLPEWLDVSVTETNTCSSIVFYLPPKPEGLNASALNDAPFRTSTYHAATPEPPRCSKEDSGRCSKDDAGRCSTDSDPTRCATGSDTGSTRCSTESDAARCSKDDAGRCSKDDAGRCGTDSDSTRCATDSGTDPGRCSRCSTESDAARCSKDDAGRCGSDSDSTRCATGSDTGTTRCSTDK